MDKKKRRGKISGKKNSGVKIDIVCKNRAQKWESGSYIFERISENW